MSASVFVCFIIKSPAVNFCPHYDTSGNTCLPVWFLTHGLRLKKAVAEAAVHIYLANDEEGLVARLSGHVDKPKIVTMIMLSVVKRIYATVYCSGCAASLVSTGSVQG